MPNNDTEIKTKVTEDEHDKFNFLAHSLGLNKSEYLRVLVKKEVYGTLPQLQTNLGTFKAVGQKEG